MNNPVFGKTMEKVRKQRDVKLVTTNKKKKSFSIRTQLSHNKMISRKRTSNRNEKKEKLNKPLYLGISILEISKTLMYEI